MSQPNDLQDDDVLPDVNVEEDIRDGDVRIVTVEDISRILKEYGILKTDWLFNTISLTAQVLQLWGESGTDKPFRQWLDETSVFEDYMEKFLELEDLSLGGNCAVSSKTINEVLAEEDIHSFVVLSRKNNNPHNAVIIPTGEDNNLILHDDGLHQGPILLNVASPSRVPHPTKRNTEWKIYVQEDEDILKIICEEVKAGTDKILNKQKREFFVQPVSPVDQDITFKSSIVFGLNSKTFKVSERFDDGLINHTFNFDTGLVKAEYFGRKQDVASYEIAEAHERINKLPEEHVQQLIEYFKNQEQ
jgi:hypothetical protein